MEYNIDILVAGCNTTCRHCYVNGGKTPIMEMEDFLCCIEKLKPVFSHFGKDIGFTLDNELYNHPKSREILEHVEKECAQNYYHHGSTTGIAILNHPEKEQIFEVLKRNGWMDVSFAIHGGKENHNKIVNHGEGMDSIVAASKMFKAAGFRVNISLMLSKLFCADLQEVSELLEVIPYDYLLPVIPDYFPTPRLERYQEIRCNDSEYNEIISFLDARNVDTTDIKSAIKQFNEKSVLSQISTDSLQKLLCEKETAFFHIDNKLDFYIGNTGVALSYCGNLRERTSEDIIDWITSSKDNYYETASIHYEDILSAVRENKMRCSKENYVYPNMIAALLAMMNNTN